MIIFREQSKGGEDVRQGREATEKYLIIQENGLKGLRILQDKSHEQDKEY